MKRLTLEILRELFVHKAGEITSIVEDHVEDLSVLEAAEGLLNAPEVLLLSLALPGKDRNTSCSDAGKGIKD